MRELDGKFSIDGDQIFNTVSGEIVPEDEPVMFFRARDHHAVEALLAYRRVCRGCNDLHIAGIDSRIEAFHKFAEEHPERMKQPGITRHIRDYRKTEGR